MVLNFTLNDDSEMAVRELATLNKSTSAELITHALALYKYMAGKAAAGNKFYYGEKLNMLTELSITTLDAIRDRSKKS